MSERLIVSPYRRPTPCEACGHEYGELVRYIFASGTTAVRFRCTCCGRLQMSDLPRSLTGDPERYPIARDNRGENPPCERCGSVGTEYHHWAPQALFEDSWEWPTGYLCVPCHVRWHRTVLGGVRTELLDAISAHVQDAVWAVLNEYGLAWMKDAA